jgi:hypothetical protein
MGGELVSDSISLDVDDRAMIHAVSSLGLGVLPREVVDAAGGWASVE